jgi:cell division protein FtsB
MRKAVIYSWLASSLLAGVAALVSKPETAELRERIMNLEAEIKQLREEVEKRESLRR